MTTPNHLTAEDLLCERATLPEQVESTRLQSNSISHRAAPLEMLTRADFDQLVWKYILTVHVRIKFHEGDQSQTSLVWCLMLHLVYLWLLMLTLPCDQHPEQQNHMFQVQAKRTTAFLMELTCLDVPRLDGRVDLAINLSFCLSLSL